jgi:hypothetical protein
MNIVYVCFCVCVDVAALRSMATRLSGAHPLHHRLQITTSLSVAS